MKYKKTKEKRSLKQNDLGKACTQMGDDRVPRRRRGKTEGQKGRHRGRGRAWPEYPQRGHICRW